MTHGGVSFSDACYYQTQKLFFRKLLIPVSVYLLIIFVTSVASSGVLEKNFLCSSYNKFEATLNDVCMFVLCVYMCVCMILSRLKYIQAQ